MSIDQSQTAHQIEHVQTAIKSIEDGPIYKFEVAPISSEVVVSVSHRIDDQLHGYAYDHQDAEHRRSLLHRIVIFEDEPF